MLIMLDQNIFSSINQLYSIIDQSFLPIFLIYNTRQSYEAKHLWSISIKEKGFSIKQKPLDQSCFGTSQLKQLKMPGAVFYVCQVGQIQPMAATPEYGHTLTHAGDSEESLL